ncbi:nucleoside deaminase [Rhizobium terrae]|uniref:nucleoside deaminase n=1 Tax=Rhizobium terrae TaxID=2171756 RepID=UPI001D03206A|nr:nucleoside deaminase [Rhizobium terrae]
MAEIYHVRSPSGIAQRDFGWSPGFYEKLCEGNNSMPCWTDENDARDLRKAFGLARTSREKGNHPFGAVLISVTGELLLEAENTVVLSGDLTAHAERNLLSLASTRFDQEMLSKATMYASTEPCSMCATAARWVGVGRIVYGLSQARLRNTGNGGPRLPPNDFSCREMFKLASRAVEIVGPLLEDEAAQVHEGFWR